MDEGGMPVGMQLIGRAAGDAEVLTAAAAYQDATNHHRHYAWSKQD
jgi:Asp-tRNA(Asn)/Glu-tRNA(Gln) amidotransferase A subunit family amidase